MNMHEKAELVLEQSRLSRSEYSRASGINYHSLRAQLDEKRGSSVTAAYWAAAWWVQDKNPSLFSQAFLNEDPDPFVDEELLKITENLEADVRKIKERVDFLSRYFNKSNEDQKELNDLLSHLTCSIRLLRLKQVAINKDIDEGDDQ